MEKERGIKITNVDKQKQCDIHVVSGSNYAVWKDAKYDYCYGTLKQAKDKEVVEYCKDFEEAKLKWKWYYYR